MSKPEQHIIISFFQKTLSEYYDAIEEFTALLEEPSTTVTEDTLSVAIDVVSRKRAKLVQTIQGARYHHDSDLGLVVPFFFPNGGIC